MVSEHHTESHRAAESVAFSIPDCNALWSRAEDDLLVQADLLPGFSLESYVLNTCLDDSVTRPRTTRTHTEGERCGGRRRSELRERGREMRKGITRGDRRSLSLPLWRETEAVVPPHWW